MKKAGFYSSGDFAHMAKVTLRTIRYYDKHNILKPSFVNDSGARFYTEEDFARLQQILLLKYLGFSLEDIREITIADSDYRFLLNSLKLQLKLVQDRMEQMQLVVNAIQDTTKAIEEGHTIDWSKMLHLIHLTNMEKSLKNQYQNASNITARIHLHQLYSRNKQGWFPWIYEQCRIRSRVKILELGCGDGSLWTNNLDKLPKEVQITLSDISEGVLRDARRAIGPEDVRFIFQSFDCQKIPFAEEQFDLIIANHLLFYCEDIKAVCNEVKRVLKSNGTFICSTYGNRHMMEVSKLVQDFDERIVLSAENLYEKFGRQNGSEILKPYFPHIEWVSYDDSLCVYDEESLISYVLSCHGNQNQYILNHYKEFRSFVKERTDFGFHITKDAGIFICKR